MAKDRGCHNVFLKGINQLFKRRSSGNYTTQNPEKLMMKINNWEKGCQSQVRNDGVLSIYSIYTPAHLTCKSRLFSFIIIILSAYLVVINLKTISKWINCSQKWLFFSKKRPENNWGTVERDQNNRSLLEIQQHLLAEVLRLASSQIFQSAFQNTLESKPKCWFVLYNHLTLKLFRNNLYLKYPVIEIAQINILQLDERIISPLDYIFLFLKLMTYVCYANAVSSVGNNILV